MADAKLSVLDSTGATQYIDNESVTTTAGSGLFRQRVEAPESDAILTAMQAGYTDTTPATQNITAADAVSTSAAGQNAQNIVTGAPTANSFAAFAISGIDTIQVQISGTWVATLVSEVSFDGGTTWYSRGVHLAGTSYITSSFTANGAGNINVAGCTNYRIRATARTSGTAVVHVTGSINPSSVYISNPLKISDPTTPTQQLAIDASGHIGVTGTFWQGTQAVSAASLPLPSGAATAANQCPPGTAGTPNANVTSVQGVSGGTQVPVVSNSAPSVTQNTAGNIVAAATAIALSTTTTALSTDWTAKLSVTLFFRITTLSAAQSTATAIIKIYRTDGSGNNDTVPVYQFSIALGAVSTTYQQSIRLDGDHWAFTVTNTDTANSIDYQVTSATTDHWS